MKRAYEKLGNVWGLSIEPTSTAGQEDEGGEEGNALSITNSLRAQEILSAPEVDGVFISPSVRISSWHVLCVLHCDVGGNP